MSDLSSHLFPNAQLSRTPPGIRHHVLKEKAMPTVLRQTTLRNLESSLERRTQSLPMGSVVSRMGAVPLMEMGAADISMTRHLRQAWQRKHLLSPVMLAKLPALHCLGALAPPMHLQARSEGHSVRQCTTVGVLGGAAVP